MSDRREQPPSFYEMGAMKMGLFDEVVSIVGQQLGGGDGQQNNLIEQAMAMINNTAMGGLPGLIEKFQKGGLE